jgi:hypothetical protein
MADESRPRVRFGEAFWRAHYCEAPTADLLARINKHGILAVDFMLDIEIASIRNSSDAPAQAARF